MKPFVTFKREAAFSTIRGFEITHFYDDIAPLVDAEFSLSAGDCVMLTGPNGAGKSTLMRIMATLLKPTDGRVVADEAIDVFEHRQHYRSHIGWVGHEPMLYPELSGRENLQFWASLHGRGAPARVERWLHQVQVDEAADRPVKTWSKGMKQRLAIARSLLHEPTVVLWDEPTSGLDQEGQELVAELADMLVNSGRICVFITHRQGGVSTAVNRRWHLEHGEIVEQHRSAVEGRYE